LGPFTAQVVYARHRRVPVTIVQDQRCPTRSQQSEEALGFLTFYEKTLDTFRPDVLMTFGSGGVTDAMISLAKRRDITVVFGIYALERPLERLFRNVDYCLTPTEFGRAHYWRTVGLHCQVVPLPIDWDRVLLLRRDPSVVAVVASNSTGESLVAAKIVETLSRTRPDIPVVLLGQDWRINRTFVAACATPRMGFGDLGRPLTSAEAYSAVKILAVPSLGHGLFERSVAEAMINGIPVLVSNQGALPEVVGSGGLVVDIPDCYRPESTQLPRADDTSPWVQAVIRLWDDSEFYTEIVHQAVSHSRCWHPSRTVPIYREFFRRLGPQPGPPLVPKWVGKPTCRAKSCEQ